MFTESCLPTVIRILFLLVSPWFCIKLCIYVTAVSGHWSLTIYVPIGLTLVTSVFNAVRHIVLVNKRKVAKARSHLKGAAMFLGAFRGNVVQKAGAR